MDNNIDTSNSEKSLSIDDFKKAYGEDFTNTIDIDTWRIGEN